MRWGIRRAMLAVVVCAVGCGVTADPKAGPGGRVEPTRPKVETMFSTLADRVAADQQGYSHTDDLLRVVNQLEAKGDITADQAAAVKQKLGTVRRPLDPADVNAIRGL